MPDPLLLNGDRPLVLFPVRLETRFFGQELRIRVFPDKIHVDTHEPELTADEVEWGKHFHTLLWNATTEEARKNAWQQLADRYGAERASWVARQLTPTNPAERPAKPPKFPSPPVRPEAQKERNVDPRAPHGRVAGSMDRDCVRARDERRDGGGQPDPGHPARRTESSGYRRCKTTRRWPSTMA